MKKIEAIKQKINNSGMRFLENLKVTTSKDKDAIRQKNLLLPNYPHFKKTYTC